MAIASIGQPIAGIEIQPGAVETRPHDAFDTYVVDAQVENGKADALLPAEHSALSAAEPRMLLTESVKVREVLELATYRLTYTGVFTRPGWTSGCLKPPKIYVRPPGNVQWALSSGNEFYQLYTGCQARITRWAIEGHEYDPVEFGTAPRLRFIQWYVGRRTPNLQNIPSGSEDVTDVAKIWQSGINAASGGYGGIGGGSGGIGGGSGGIGYPSASSGRRLPTYWKVMRSISDPIGSAGSAVVQINEVFEPFYTIDDWSVS